MQQVHEVGQTTKAVLGTQARAEEENGLMHVLLFCINKIFIIFTCSPVRRSTLCPGDQGAEDGLVTEAAPEEGGQTGHRRLVLRHGGLHVSQTKSIWFPKYEMAIGLQTATAIYVRKDLIT